MITTQQQLQCPFCKNVLTLQHQQQGLQDVVCEWSDTPMLDDRPMIAGITPDGGVILKLTTVDGLKPMISITLGEEVPTVLGPQTFRLEEIYSGVLKLHPSIADPQIHAFVTIVGAPKDWKKNVPA